VKFVNVPSGRMRGKLFYGNKKIPPTHPKEEGKKKV
jgi:hypothetical protein